MMQLLQAILTVSLNFASPLTKPLKSVLEVTKSIHATSNMCCVRLVCFAFDNLFSCQCMHCSLHHRCESPMGLIISSLSSSLLPLTMGRKWIPSADGFLIPDPNLPSIRPLSSCSRLSMRMDNTTTTL